MTGWRLKAVGADGGRRPLTPALRRALTLLCAVLALLGACAASASAAPINDFPPQVEGNAQIGERLVCGAGTWNDVAHFGFAWVRDGLPIASGVAYTVRPEDEGHLIWCVVTATVEEYPRPPESAEVPSVNSISIPGVLPSSPVPIEAPVLSGRAALNEQLSCSSGGWSGTPPLTFTYEWVRDPGPEETLVEGASSPTHTVTADDQGHALACRVMARNAAGSASSRSNALGIAGTPPAVILAPRVLGLPVASEGEMLACSGGEWGGRPRPKLSYEWLSDGIVIATGSAYKIVAADQLHTLSCRVSAKNIAGQAEASSSNSIKVRGSAPQNTQAPSVLGALAVGSTLTCIGGEWSGVPAPELSYVWVRNLGLSGEEALGSSSEYTVVGEDAGKTLACEVTAKNQEGESARSSEAVVVPKGGTAPESVLAPTVAGEARLGATLTCEAGTWTGNPEPKLTYQWRRDGSALAGRTSSTYRVENGDEAHSLSCRVTAANEAGSAHRDSANSKRIPGVAPRELEAPRVIGAPEVNEVLTCLTGAWSGAPPPALAWQWLRNGSPIPGGSERNYTLSAEDRGFSISCRVSASNEGGSAEATSAGVQIPGNEPHNIRPPQILGKEAVGDVLTCLPGSWSGAPAPVYTYQWLLEGSKIPSATGETYTVASADMGLVLACEVTATNKVASASASSAGVRVPGIKPENREAPRVSGGAAVGAVLKCEPGRWEGKPPPVLAYQWLRDGAVVASATGATYTVELGDEGHALGCRVTATNGDGKAEAASSSVSIPRPETLAEGKSEPASQLPEGLQGPTRAEILARLGAQLARAQHHAHISSIRRSGSYSFSLTAPMAGKLELSWFLASSGGHRSANLKPLVVAFGSATFEAAATKTVKLRLTSAGRRLLERSFSLQLTLRAVFLRPQKPSLLWTKTVGLDH